MRVLIACEFSGIVRDAFRAKGHDAWSCDLLPTERPGPHYQGNVLCDERLLYVLYKKWDLMIAHPPCNFLTVAANKYMKPEYSDRFPTRHQDRDKAADFFMSLANAPIERICIENPVGVMSSLWRKPDQIIQPYEFGHPDRKRTCLWLKNLPPLMATCIVTPHIRINRNGQTASVHHDKTLGLPPNERWKARSRTYQGIANAMADQWG